MAEISEIINLLNELLRPQEFSDFGPNGLQVPGKEVINRVVTGVTANRAFIDAGLAADADLLLVHHGLFLNSAPAGLTRALAERLRPIMRSNCNLAAYHLPLDGHAKVGNNALLAEALGCPGHEAFAFHEGQAIGRVGRFSGSGLAAQELFDRVAAVTSRQPLVIDAGPEQVRQIGIVSGGGAGYLADAVALGLDALITGEPRENVMGEANEAGIHFIAAGHYATETFGVKALGDLLAERFGIIHTFVDIPNPILILAKSAENSYDLW